MDLGAMTGADIAAYAERLVEDRLLPTDPPLVWRPYVDRSAVVRQSARSGEGFADWLLSSPLEDGDLRR